LANGAGMAALVPVARPACGASPQPPAQEPQVALVTAPLTPRQASRFNSSPSTRSGLVGGGITTPSSFLKPKRE
jgi:hypothetical protein